MDRIKAMCKKTMEVRSLEPEGSGQSTILMHYIMKHCAVFYTLRTKSSNNNNNGGSSVALCT